MRGYGSDLSDIRVFFFNQRVLRVQVLLFFGLKSSSSITQDQLVYLTAHR